MLRLVSCESSVTAGFHQCVICAVRQHRSNIDKQVPNNGNKLIGNTVPTKGFRSQTNLKDLTQAVHNNCSSRLNCIVQKTENCYDSRLTSNNLIRNAFCEFIMFILLSQDFASVPYSLFYPFSILANIKPRK